jgi:hypothetical protein
MANCSQHYRAQHQAARGIPPARCGGQQAGTVPPHAKLSPVQSTGIKQQPADRSHQVFRGPAEAIAALRSQLQELDRRQNKLVCQIRCKDAELASLREESSPKIADQENEREEMCAKLGVLRGEILEMNCKLECAVAAIAKRSAPRYCPALPKNSQGQALPVSSGSSCTHSAGSSSRRR